MSDQDVDQPCRFNSREGVAWCGVHGNALQHRGKSWWCPIGDRPLPFGAAFGSVHPATSAADPPPDVAALDAEKLEQRLREALNESGDAVQMNKKAVRILLQLIRVADDVIRGQSAREQQLAATRAALLKPRQPISDEESRDLLQTMDGAKWANAFCRATGFHDEGWALTWFCNAIMACHDEVKRRESAALQRVEQERDAEKAAYEEAATMLSAVNDENCALSARLAQVEAALKEIATMDPHYAESQDIIARAGKWL